MQVETNVNALHSMEVGGKIEIKGKVFELERTRGYSFYLTHIERTAEADYIRHVRCPRTEIATFSRQELVERLLSGDYVIS